MKRWRVMEISPNTRNPIIITAAHNAEQAAINYAAIFSGMLCVKVWEDTVKPKTFRTITCNAYHIKRNIENG